jgi:hypothetical protein
VRSIIGTKSFPIVLEVEALAFPCKKWVGHLSLPIMSDMFSTKNMLNFFVKGEGEDEPSPRKQRIFKGVEEEKKFQYLKFGEGLSNGIVCV